MGGIPSKKSLTALECMVENFSKFRELTQTPGCNSPQKLRSLCELDWVQFNTGWPGEGSYDLKDIRTVVRITAEVHPDQFPYAEAWENAIITQPAWLKKCQNKECAVFVALTNLKKPQADKKKRRFGIFPCPEEEVSNPPPYVPMYPQLKAIDNERPTLVPQATSLTTPTASDTSPGESKKSPLIDLASASRWLQNITEEFLRDSPIAGRTRSHSNPNPKITFQLPLRSMVQYVQEIDNKGELTLTPKTTYQHVPFTTSDLLNWKSNNPPYTENPQPLINLCETIMASHQPDWSDCQQLLQALFTSEERRRILNQGTQLAQTYAAEKTSYNPIEWAAGAFPLTNPNWDPNISREMEYIVRYREFLMEALKKGPQKVINLKKIQEVMQGKDESPGAYLERLLEAYRKYSPYDPESKDGSALLNTSFVTQSAPDIRRKLQKQDGFAGMNLSQLIEIATKVFIHRDEAEKRERKKIREEDHKIFLNLLDERDKLKESESGNRRKRGMRQKETRGVRGMPLGRHQCAICRQEGHWKNECPSAQGTVGIQRGMPSQRGHWRGRGRGGGHQGGYANLVPGARYGEKREEEFVGMVGLGEDWTE
ncbi:uncharacterized protein [Anolis sagrei]|uniref:uncharacterized protein n=1 Tax=Anolis sagrei TaxID=38937 RepID=UPI003521CE43